MYRLPILGFTILVLGGARHVCAAPFQNLDFEQATVLLPDPSRPALSVAVGIPYWSATEDSSIQDAIGVNWILLDETQVTLITQSVTITGYPSPLLGNPIKGNFSALLAGYADAPPEFFKTAAISQTGDIPASAKTILFYIRPVPSASAVPLVYLNGTMVNTIRLSTSNGVTLMAGDISAFAGTTSELTFAAIGIPGSFPTDEDYYELDNISFSTVAVPEPGVAGLTLLAAFPFLIKRIKRGYGVLGFRTR